VQEESTVNAHLPKGIAGTISSISERVATAGSQTDARPELAIAVKPSVWATTLKVEGPTLMPLLSIVEWNCF